MSSLLAFRAMLASLALLDRVSGTAFESCQSDDTVDFIQVEVASERRGSNDSTPDTELVPSDMLIAQLQKHCLKRFAKPLHAVGVDMLGDTKYLDDADLEDVGLKLVHRRKIRATGKASEETNSSASSDGANLIHLASARAQGICEDDELDETAVEAALELELKGIGLEGFTSAFRELGVQIASDTAVLSDAELETVGLQVVQLRRLRETVPFQARLPARDPENQPSLQELGLGDLGKKLVKLGVRNLQDIEYLDDAELAKEGLLLVHRRKMRAADAQAQARSIEAAKVDAELAEDGVVLLHRRKMRAADAQAPAKSIEVTKEKEHVSLTLTSSSEPLKSAGRSRSPKDQQCGDGGLHHTAIQMFINGELEEHEFLEYFVKVRGERKAAKSEH